ncbi:MAG: sel1 repeat family protein [Gammaproteobacteria bacterium]|nr:MAG: sel1 repeat family protein [Gammaproteobacteria bacterium]
MSQMDQHLLAESELTTETINLQQRAYTGDAKAQYALADVFQTGDHVQKNANHAFFWYQRAAKQGNVLAQYMVWMAYKIGDGIEANAQEANKWFARASLKNAGSTQSIVSQILNRVTLH